MGLFARWFKRRFAEEKKDVMKYLIAGLGNVGDEYVDTRHNAGFRMADALAERLSVPFSVQRYAAVAEGRIKSREVVIIKPSTYMNLSGKAIRYWMQKENVPLERLLVLVDDIALPFGTLRMRTKGGPGGHNGLKDIESVLGSQAYARIRLGVGDAFARGGQVDYVLGTWSDEEKKALDETMKVAVEMISQFVLVGPEKTMNVYNHR